MKPSTPYNYSFTLPFEDTFDFIEWQKWMEHNWTSSFYYAAIYVIVIFGIQNFMRDRKRLELRAPLIIWNIALAAVSFGGAMRLVPDLVTILRYNGFNHSICYGSLPEVHQIPGFWLWMMTMCKLVELGDTLFIVLRKQPLIFLHWYHHFSTLICTWYAFGHAASNSRWFMAMNCCVHAIMYTYYALKAMKFKLSRRTAMMVTVVQLMQMVVGSYNILKARQLILNGFACHSPIMIVNLSMILYVSNFLNFAYFFYKSYFSGKNEKILNGKSK